MKAWYLSIPKLKEYMVVLARDKEEALTKALKKLEEEETVIDAEWSIQEFTEDYENGVLHFYQMW